MNRLAMISELTDEALVDGSDCGEAFDTAVSRLALNDQIAPPLYQQQPQVSGQAREVLLSGAAPRRRDQPLPDLAMTAQWMVVDSLLADVEEQGESGDRLYALEFQGLAGQYVMFGHTTDPKARLDEHTRAATPHGWALLNGWLSTPLLPDARQAELALLRIGGRIHPPQHFRERFYNMPYERGLNLARCVFAHFSEPDVVALIQSRRQDRLAGRKAGRQARRGAHNVAGEGTLEATLI